MVDGHHETSRVDYDMPLRRSSRNINSRNSYNPCLDGKRAWIGARVGDLLSSRPSLPLEQSQSVFRTINRNRLFNLQYFYLSFVLDSRWTRRSGKQWPMPEQDQRISEVVTREQSRLRDFIRRRVADPADVEDIVQEVFYELVEANRLLMPIDHVTRWLFSVSLDRIIDLFRKKKPTSFSEAGLKDFS